MGEYFGAHKEDKSLLQESAIGTEVNRKSQDVLVKLLLWKESLDVDELCNPGVSAVQAG